MQSAPPDAGWGARDLMGKLFEVVFASGVEPERAFGVIDRDANGAVSLEDFAIVLRDLGIPLTAGELSAAAHSMVKGDRIDLADFARRYRAWAGPRAPEQGRRSPSPRPLLRGSLSGASARHLPPTSSPSSCLDLPSCMLFACLGAEGSSRVPAEAVASFAERCLGLPPASARQVASVCDLAGRGQVAYRDFRRYLARLDKERAAQLTAEEAQVLTCRITVLV